MRSLKERIADFNPQDFTHRVMLFGLILLVIFWVALALSVSVIRASSFALGGVLSLVNFKWLKDMVDVAIYKEARRKRHWVPLKFFLRYGLILISFYGILRVSRIDLLYAFLGLFISVGAMLVECVYQLARSFEKGQ